MSDPLFRKALRVCLDAHMQQKDAHGEPYAIHSISVANTLVNPDDQICALLHDVIEDTDISRDNLINMGFPKPIVDTVELLSRKPNERYENYISRIETNPQAVRIKIADLRDNLDTSRGPIPGNLEKRYSVTLDRLLAVHERYMRASIETGDAIAMAL